LENINIFIHAKQWLGNQRSKPTENTTASRIGLDWIGLRLRLNDGDPGRRIQELRKNKWLDWIGEYKLIKKKRFEEGD